MNNNELSIKNDGSVKISDEVIATIASVAVSEVEGVSALSGSFAGDLVEKFGKKNLTKGIKVNIDEENVEVDINIVVKYGVKIPDVAHLVQENVKKAIESMSDLNVEKINIHVTSVDLEN